jgi:hypothetical protein
MKAIHCEMFYADGRGPELQRVCWGGRGSYLQAIEYFNPDDVYEPQNLKHVRFAGAQVVQITPEEVIDYGSLACASASDRRVALVSLGRSSWLKSFDPRHLQRCAHFQLLFYDQLFDVICEEVTCHRGAFTGLAG